MPTKKASEEVIEITAKVPVKKKSVSKAIVLSDAQPSELSREVGAHERQLKVADVLMPVMNQAQMNMLCGSTPKHVIRTRPGRGGKTFRYIPYGYAVDSLNKAFGFDWDFIILPVFNGNLFKQTDVITAKYPKNHALSGQEIIKHNVTV